MADHDDFESNRAWLVLWACLIGFPVVLVEVFKEKKPMSRTPTFLYRQLALLLLALVVATVTSAAAPFVPERYTGGADLTVFLLGGFNLVQKIGEVGAKWLDAGKLCSLYNKANKLCRRPMHKRRVLPEGHRARVKETPGHKFTRGFLREFGQGPDETNQHWLPWSRMIPMSARLEDFDGVEGYELRYHLAALYKVTLSHCGCMYSPSDDDMRWIFYVASNHYPRDARNDQQMGEADATAYTMHSPRRTSKGRDATQRKRRGVLRRLRGLGLPARLCGVDAASPPDPPSLQTQPQDPLKWLEATEDVLTFAVNAARKQSWTRMHEAAIKYDHKTVSRIEVDGNKGLLAVAQELDSPLFILASVVNKGKDSSGDERLAHIWMSRIMYDNLVLAMELTAMSDYLSCTRSKAPLAATLGDLFFTQEEWKDLQVDSRDDRQDDFKEELWLSWFCVAVFSVPILLFLVFYMLSGKIPVEQGAEMLAMCLQARLKTHMDEAVKYFGTSQHEQYDRQFGENHGLTTRGFARKPDMLRGIRGGNKERQCTQVEFEAALRLLRAAIVHVRDVFCIVVDEHLGAVDALSQPLH